MAQRCGLAFSAGTHSLVVAVLATGGILTVTPAWARAAPQPSTVAVADTSGERAAALRTRLYFGMWSTHFRDLGEGLASNALIGFAHRGFFGATFINSYGSRAVSVGMQRNFSSPKPGTWTTAIGYRAGIVTGYDERFFGIGDKSPILPFAQLVGTLDYRSLGIELAYSGIVASVAMNWGL